LAEADAGWPPVLDGLLEAHVSSAGSHMRPTADRLRAAGGRVFEIAVGTLPRHGLRITWRPADPSGAHALAEAAGLAEHPWGAPDWIGLRTGSDGVARCKAYHRRPPPLGITTAHRGLLPECAPVMAALDGDVLEIYATLPAELGWDEFAARALAVLPASATGLPEFRPRPRRRAHGFAMSARHRGSDLEAITLYAFGRSLPDAEKVVTEWSSALTTDEHALYAAAVSALTARGQPLADLHGLLAWSFDASGAQTRAACLRVRDQLSR
jgi:hypothetical protein